MKQEISLKEHLDLLTAEHDELMNELIYIDHLMRSIGFVDGLNTVKQTAKQMCRKELGLDEEEDLLDENEENR